MARRAGRLPSIVSQTDLATKSGKLRSPYLVLRPIAALPSELASQHRWREASDEMHASSRMKIFVTYMNPTDSYSFSWAIWQYENPARQPQSNLFLPASAFTPYLSHS